MMNDKKTYQSGEKMNKWELEDLERKNLNNKELDDEFENNNSFNGIIVKTYKKFGLFKRTVVIAYVRAIKDEQRQFTIPRNLFRIKQGYTITDLKDAELRLYGTVSGKFLTKIKLESLTHSVSNNLFNLSQRVF